MKHLVAILTLALSFIQPAFADDPGPLAPCFALMSNGWEILRLRNAGVPIETLEAKIQAAKAPAEEKADALAFVHAAWEAPGDGWEWISEKHRECIRQVRYNQ
jgi:hypothetical protein